MDNSNVLLKRVFNSNRFILLHFLLYSLGLININLNFSSWFVKILFPPHISKLSEYLFPLFFYPQKKYELFSYIFGAAILFVYYCICFLLMVEKKNQMERFWKIKEENINLYLILTFIINLLLLMSSDDLIYLVIKICIWFIAFFGILFFCRADNKVTPIKFFNKKISINHILIVLGILIFTIAICLYLMGLLHGIRFKILRFLFWIECLGVIIKFIMGNFGKSLSEFLGKWINYKTLIALGAFILVIAVCLYLMDLLRGKPLNILKFLFWIEISGILYQTFRYIRNYGINYKVVFTIACYIMFVFVLAQAVHMFMPFIFEEPKLINEYYNIPEKTLIQSNEAFDHKKKIIDNIDFFNKHLLLGDHRRYDIEHDKTSNPLPINGTFINVPKNPRVVEFIKTINGGTKYYYDDRLQALCIIGPMEYAEKLKLEQIYDDKATIIKINDLYSSNQILQKQIKKRIFTTEEKLFWDKNSFEFRWQILNRWVIHHHNHIMGPINELYLGKNVNKIFMQYGWLNTVVIKDLMLVCGGISYQNYFKLYYLFYYIYFILFVFLLFLIFKHQIEYILLTLILSFSALNEIGFQLLMLGPGMNPIRHFFDIFVILFFILYFRSYKLIFMILSCFFSIMAILNNSQFGIFALLAMMVSYGIQICNDFYERNHYKIGFMIITFIVSLIAVYFTRNAYDPISKYFLKGLLGFTVSQSVLLALLVLFSIGYFILINILSLSNRLKYLAFFLFFYSQELLVYYIWGGGADHWLDLVPIYALTGIVILYILFDNIRWLKENKIVLFCFTIVLIVTMCYIPSVIKYYDEKTQFEKVFTNHQVYQWSFKRAKLKSTMDPKYFSDSIRIMTKYSKHRKIYIISKYDNILPFLADKYSGMPFFEVSSFCFSQQEVNQCIDTIKKTKPEYIFIDTDIDRTLNTDIVNPNGDTGYLGFLNVKYEKYLKMESISRVQRLALLKIIFNSVRNDYVPVENGYLITAYRKKI